MAGAVYGYPFFLSLSLAIMGAVHPVATSQWRRGGLPPDIGMLAHADVAAHSLATEKVRQFAARGIGGD